MNRIQLEGLVKKSLRKQGFRIRAGRIVAPNPSRKDELRKLHALAVSHLVERAKKGLVRYEKDLRSRVAPGDVVVPERIQPRLVQVLPNSPEELLFRYASLHWSVPVSSGYGRRLRFLVLDDSNGKLIGLFGLADPVFSLAPRDNWIGWDKEARKQRLQHVMEAFVLGAVPPYSYLLCGKLIAMLVTSNEVRKAFATKYQHRRSVILGRRLSARLALIMTTSALGRSSIYNRLRYRADPLFKSVGFTSGSGEFHLSDGLYKPMRDYAVRYCAPTAKQVLWGSGFRSKREVLRKALIKIGLSGDLLYHGIGREIFAIPLAHNTRPFLQGEHSRLRYVDRPAEDLFSWFRERWLLPRAANDKRYKAFSPSSYAIWDSAE